ncbi:hypothetical protein PIB30_011607 [Stylosanthes scabra]|uniref:Uncharacterized protein n=1 Tax=Stylosanthes scabra TaxID=79078 RepID=A0ABU6V531_9FABA|nr:hypothetical protein [Stylosanthes scabra]
MPSVKLICHMCADRIAKDELQHSSWLPLFCQGKPHGSMNAYRGTYRPSTNKEIERKGDNKGSAPPSYPSSTASRRCRFGSALFRSCTCKRQNCSSSLAWPNRRTSKQKESHRREDVVAVRGADGRSFIVVVAATGDGALAVRQNTSKVKEAILYGVCERKIRIEVFPFKCFTNKLYMWLP